MKDLKYWTHICIEAYCFINMEYNSKYHPYVYKLKKSSLRKNGKMKFEKEDNPDYDPNAKRPSKPTFCKKKLCFECLSNNCEYLGFCEARKNKKKHSKKKPGSKYNLR